MPEIDNAEIHDSEEYGKFTETEVSRALNDTKRDTAPGKDKWGLAAAKSIGAKNIAILFSH